MHNDTLRKHNDQERRLISQAECRTYHLPLSPFDSETEINEWLARWWPRDSKLTIPHIKEDGTWSVA